MLPPLQPCCSSIAITPSSKPAMPSSGASRHLLRCSAETWLRKLTDWLFLTPLLDLTRLSDCRCSHLIVLGAAIAFASVLIDGRSKANDAVNRCFPSPNLLTLCCSVLFAALLGIPAHHFLRFRWSVCASCLHAMCKLVSSLRLVCSGFWCAVRQDMATALRKCIRTMCS